MNEVNFLEVEDLVKKEAITQEAIDFSELVAQKTKNMIDNSTQAQIKFYKDFAKLLYCDLKDKKPVIIPSRCGFGKTTVLQNAILYHIEDKKDKLEDLGLIIIMERLEDLKALANKVNESFDNPMMYVMEGWNKNISCKQNIKLTFSLSQFFCTKEHCINFSSCKLNNQNEEQTNYPILGMTHARLNQILLNGNINKFNFFKSGGRFYYRKTMIVDEKPMLTYTSQIPLSLLAQLRDTIKHFNKYITDDEKNQKYLLKVIRILIKEILLLAKENKGKTIFLNINKRNKIDDHYKKTYLNYDKNKKMIKLISFLQLLYKFGCLGIFSPNNTKLFVVSQNIFKTNNIKTLILDGTSSRSFDYNNQHFNFLKVDDPKSFTHLYFNIINDVNVTKYGIKFNTKKIEATLRWLDSLIKNSLKARKIMLISYLNAVYNSYAFNDIEKSKTFNDLLSKIFRNNKNVIKDKNNRIPYFSNVKGKNDWRICDVFIQFGFNRYDSNNYFAKYISTNPKIYNNLLKDFKNNVSQEEFFNIKPNGDFNEKTINDYMLREIAIDLEQNIYRCCLRDYFSTKRVDVYLFSPAHQILEYLKEVFPKSNFNYLSLMGESEEIKSITYGNSDINKILNWIDTVDVKIQKGFCIPVAKLKKELSISHGRWNYLSTDKDFINLLKKRNYEIITSNRKVSLRKLK